ncbi:hypothetical protein AB0D67_38520 [Streptosporangium sp. NPDC048047]|uniref:hypothetical protein n=1 Tax=Streptosporangium sp. NPDC048047 TaxID=3155748 RepID=UPI0034189281
MGKRIALKLCKGSSGGTQRFQNISDPKQEEVAMSDISSGEIVGECIIDGQRIRVRRTTRYDLIANTGEVVTAEQPFSTYPSEGEIEAVWTRCRHHLATVDAFTLWATAAGITEEDLDPIVHDLFSEPASETNNHGLAGQIEEMIRAYGPEGARNLLADCVPAAPGPLYALSELRGRMSTGYDDGAVNSVLGQISEAVKQRLVCVWDKIDTWGVGGNSQFYWETEDGQLLELVGELWPWLNGDSHNPGTPHFPGTPASWIGPPTGMTTTSLTWTDGFHNYAGWDDDEQDTGEDAAAE